MEELSRQQFQGEERHSWKEAVLKWNEGFLRGIAPKTAARYMCSIRQIDHLLADLSIDQITPKVVAQVATRKGPTNATLRRDLTALSSVLRSCVGWGWLESNPAKAYDRAIIPERRDPIHLPEDADVDALIAVLAPGLAQLVRFLDLTGCREEEAADLKHNQLDLRLQNCILRKTKRNRIRTISLVNPAAPHGLEYTKEYTATGTGAYTVRHYATSYVFWHAEGIKADRYRNVASQLSNAINKLAKAGKINKFRIHDLRHRFAVRWLRAGGDIYALSRHLGHTSVKTTEIYLQFVERDPRKGSTQTRAQVHRLFDEIPTPETS